MRAFVVLLAALVAMYPVAASSQATKEKYEKIQQEILSNKEKLEEAKGKGRSALESLEKINREFNVTTAQIGKQRKTIADLERRSKALKEEIAEKEGSLATKRVLLKKRLQTMQRYGIGAEKMAVLLKAESFYDLIRMSKYLARISEYEYRQLIEYRQTAEKLMEQEKQLAGVVEELRVKNETLRKAEKELGKKKKEREAILLAVKKEQILYESMLKELETTSTKVKQLLDRSSDNDFSSEGSEFRGLKGKLPWPTRGKLAIPYGAHEDPQFKTPVFRNGIYISTREEEVVQSVHEGKVVFADWFKGLGQVVIVNHGEGYHTVYANLSNLNPKVGDVIKKKDKIGYAGNSGVLEGSGIYFEVRYKGKPVNPLQWLTGNN